MASQHPVCNLTLSQGRFPLSLNNKEIQRTINDCSEPKTCCTVQAFNKNELNCFIAVLVIGRLGSSTRASQGIQWGIHRTASLGKQPASFPEAGWLALSTSLYRTLNLDSSKLSFKCVLFEDTTQKNIFNCMLFSVKRLWLWPPLMIG